MPKTITTPILVALALLVGFLAVQQAKPVEALAARVRILDASAAAPVDFGTVGTVLTAEVDDSDLVGVGTLTVELTSTADTDTYPALTLTEGAAGVFQVAFALAAATDALAVPVELAVEHGDEVRITYFDADPGIGLRDTITADLKGPDFDDLTPEDGTIDNDEIQTISVEITDVPAGVAEASIRFLIADVQRSQVETEAGTGIIEVSAGSTSDIEDPDGNVIGFAAEIVIGIVGDATKFLGASALDEAGNKAWFDVDDTDDTVTLSRITVDTIDPFLAEAFTGLAFDEESTDCDITACDLDDNRDWILAVFVDANDLDGSSVDDEDFFVVGHTLSQVKWFDEDGTVDNEASDGPWNIRNLVFIQLAEELNSDETPTVFVVPVGGGISDAAGNINNSDEVEAADRIGPLFQIEDFDPPPSSSSLVGKEVEVTFTITADEDLQGNEPRVTAWDVFSPGPGSALAVTVASAATNRWDVVVDEVGSDTATIYNIHIVGEDTIGNTAELGIGNVDFEDPADLDEDSVSEEPDGIVDEFFETVIDTVVSPAPGFASFSNFDVSGISPDAVFFEGDTADLAWPVTTPAEGEQLDISGKPPIILDFASEGNEYPGDSHGLVTLILAELDGVDVLATASTEDGQKWLVPSTGLSVGPHALVINAMDEAGNELAGAAFTLRFTAVSTPETCGDLNGDGIVNVFDAIMGLQIIVGLIEPTPAQLVVIDVVRDGDINVFDAILLLQHIVGLTEITECGPPAA